MLSQNIKESQQLQKFYNILTRIQQIDPDKNQSMQSLQFKLQILCQLNTTLSKLSSIGIQALAALPNEHSENENNKPENHQYQKDVVILKKQNNQPKLKIGEILYGFITNILIYLRTQHKKTGINIYFQILFTSKYDELLSKKWKWMETGPDYVPEQQIINLTWINPKSYNYFDKNMLFYNCLNLVLTYLYQQNTIPDFSFVIQCYKLILKTIPFVSKTLIIQLSLKILKLTVIILNNPDTKQQCIKQITQKSIKILKQIVTSIMKQIQNDRSVSKLQIMNFKKQYEQIGNSMSLVLLRNQSLQKKLVGLKLLCCESIGEEQFYQWIQKNEILSTVLKENNQEVYISNSVIILKTIFKYIKQDKQELQKILKFAQHSTAEVRKCILKYIESTIFLQNYSIHDQILLAFVADQAWLLSEQVWSIITKFITKISNRTNQYVIDRLFYLYFQAVGLGENKYFANKCKNIIADMFYKLLDHRNSVSIDELWEKIIKYFQYLLTLPINLNKIILLLSITEKIIQKNVRKDFKQRLADYLISQHQIIEKVVVWVKQAEFKNIQQKIQHFLKNLVGKASQKIKITYIQKFQIILKASQNVNLFKIFLHYYKSVAQFKHNFKQFIQNCYKNDNQCFSPIKCIRHYFLTLNQKQIQQFENSQSFQTKKVAPQLQGLQTIISCLNNASIAEARNELAQLIADICTSYSQEIAQAGQNNLISIFLQFIQNFDNEYQVAQQTNQYKQLLAWLALAKQLMLITEIQGKGNLKPHNSLVATHYTNVIIINQLKTFISHKDNKYEKRLPCNMSLVEVMKEVCNMFMCDIYEIKLLQEDHQIPVRKYGLTLQELNIHNKTLRVVSGYTRKFHKKQKICVDGKLTEKAQKAFTQIFHHFAKNGKLGHNQCIDFIAGVTKTQIKLKDDRVDRFINQYANMNGDILLDNFLKFYSEKATQNKYTDIWKNLTNMGFRYDLKRNFQPRDPLPQILMLRSYLSKSKAVYETLFATARSQNLQLRQRSIQLLFHLPSYEQNYLNLKEFLNSRKDSFQIQYLLIALQNDIQIGHDFTQNQSKRKQLINQNQIQEIFNILQRLYQKKNKSSKQQNCLLICVKILRSLSLIPDLRYKIKDTQNIIQLCQFKLPSTMLFIQLLNKALVQKDIQALQWLFVLQITQIHSDLTANSALFLALLGVFDQEKEIRQITCNFIYFIALLGKDITEIYKVQAGQNCDIWYQTLTKIIQANNDNIDFQQILYICFKNMQKKRQSIQNFGDLYIYGNLSTILSIIKKYKLNLSFQKIVNIAEYVISPASRKLIYEILSYIDLNKTVIYLKQLITNYKVQNYKELNPKSKYIGLNNLGCTCYINSVLQILFSITNLRHQLLSLNPINIQSPDLVNSNNESNQLFEQIQRIFFYLQNGYNRYYDMQKFCQVYTDKRNQHIDVKQQEDAHQFYNQFCQVLQGFFEKNEKKETFQNLMTGKTMLEYVCIDCNNKLQRQQKFESLNLVVKDCSNLSESLKKYIKPQQIEDYFCENCKKKVKKITKYTTLSKLPDYMMLNLQRIEIDIQIYKKIKIASRFQFSQFLNLSQYVYNFSTQNQHLYSYKLKAVIIHAGSAESGHYYCLINIAEKWYKFDDRNVLECDVKDLEKEGFGGTQDGHHFQFNQQTFSTSAYILCYERCNLQQKAHEKQKMSFQMAQFIKIEKIQIFSQLKICNDSIFQFFIGIFNKYKPDGIQQAAKNNTYKPDWILDPNLQHYTQIFNLSVALLLFLKKFWKLSNPAHISNLGTQIIYLLYLLPESTYQFLEKTSLLQCKQMLCFHPDAIVRNIYKNILVKSLHIFFFYYQYNLEHDQPVVHNIRQIICGLKGFLEEPEWHVNIYQLDSYFQFWSLCAQQIQPIINYMLESDIFIRFAEILQHDSSQNYVQKYQKIKQEENSEKNLITVPLVISSSICTIIQILVKYKFSQTGKSDKINHKILNQYTQKQKQILTCTQFYSNILNNEYENNKVCLSSAIACFSKHNQFFSKQMAQIFLKGLKSYEEKTHSMWIMLQYIWHFLQVKDQFSIKRINWILGISQLEIGEYLTCGFHKNSVNSNVFNFVSTLYFSEFNKYPPLLQKLVIQSQQGKQNKNTFNLLNFVLQICGQSQNILKLLCSLPSPNYLYCSYFEWLSIYIQKLANINGSQQLTGIPNLEASMIEMYYGLKQKINQLKIGGCTAWPYIIGRNHKLHQIYSRQLYLFRITVYEHQTYVLAQHLDGSKNLSLPNNFFQTQVSNYFISQKSGVKHMPDQFKLEQSQNLPQFKKTVISCEIKTQCPTKLTFKIDTFKQQIYIQAGYYFINLPYVPLDLTDQNMMSFIEIDILDAKQVTWSNRKFSYNDDKAQCQIMVEDNIYEKNCPKCTYLNDLSSLQCGMCENKF